MIRILLFCFLFFNVAISWSADFRRTIKWINPDQSVRLNGRSALGFTGSIDCSQTGLPFWFESFELKSTTAEVVIKNEVFEPVQDTVIYFKTVLDSNLYYKTEIGHSSGKSFLRLTINPFVRRNNRIEKLIAFTVSLEEHSNSLKSSVAAYGWKSTSVLGSGKWIKIKTKNKGIYKISYDQLKLWGFSNPDQVSMYGNGGYMMPVLNNDLRVDDLLACPVWKGKDGGSKDCLFFYSSGTVQINEDLETGTFAHQQNHYSQETFFYLSDQGAVRIFDKKAEMTEPAGRKVISFSNYLFHEKETSNLISSGSRWFGEQFNDGGSHTVNLSLDNPELTKPALFLISAAGRSSASSVLEVSLNGKPENDILFRPIDVSDLTVYYADDHVVRFSEMLATKNIQLKMTYNAANSSSDAWLDHITVNYQSILNINSDVYFFRGRGVDGQIPVSEFVVGGATASTKILDVTDLNNPVEIPAVYADGQMKFKSNSGITLEYVAFNPTGTIPVPELTGTVDNQNLHSSEMAEMIIVANPVLQSAAGDLAEFHRLKDQMTVQVVTPEMIYNEFSGGQPNPSGIRNYFRMNYERGKQNGKNTLKYILLMGDGSFDNRNILGKNHNLIPTFQSDNSLSPTESFVTDDFFVFLDPNEGGFSGTVDLGIGRIPARNPEEAEIVVDKIRNYQLPEAMGNWRNVVTFIGDDEDNNTHMDQAESLADFVNRTYPAFYADKIYFDAYKQLSTSGGEKYPDVTAAINNRVKQGTLLMNYTGHANEKNLAAENVLDVGIINSWTNSKRFPVFVTATCEFSRFDSNETSAGEYILFNPTGGGVGLFSTTRLVYSGANFVLNSSFFKYIFAKDPQGNNLRLGDVMRLAKASSNTGINQLNFTLLADPAMRLAFPNNQVKTTSMNGKNVESETDTIRTLSVVTVKGYVVDSKGVKLTTFNGEIVPTVYDKAMQVKTLGNAGEEPMSYTTQSNIIYKGLSEVKNGEFEFSFFVPRDISYKLDKGKILYYAYNESVDAQGYFDNFFIGGSSNATLSDSEGPEVELFMNSEEFKSGGTVSASSVLIARISDETGINTAGTGIGHDITAVLDGDYSNIMVLNDYFQADLNSYTTGRIVFPFTNLTEGEHVLIVKVWDVLNNSSEKEIRFVVKDDFRIESVVCYPNPMQIETRFVFTHNQPDETFDVSLEIFQSSGTRVDQVNTIVGSQGTESLPIVWVPSEQMVRMTPGVYIYRISATTKDSKRKMSSGSGRLVFNYR